jgi:hypothetical protein
VAVKKIVETVKTGSSPKDFVDCISLIEKLAAVKDEQLELAPECAGDLEYASATKRRRRARQELIDETRDVILALDKHSRTHHGGGWQ